jgi:hypothetical protein
MWRRARSSREVDEPLHAAPAMGRGFASVTTLRASGHAQAAE